MSVHLLDAAFGEVAVKRGLLTPAQLHDARQAQESERPAASLPVVLVERCLLTPARVAEVFAGHVTVWLAADARAAEHARTWRMAALLLARGWASPGAVQRTLRAWAARVAAGEAVPALEELLVAGGAFATERAEEACAALLAADSESALAHDPAETAVSSRDAADSTGRDGRWLPPARPAEPKRPPAELRRVGKYELRELLGRGGMGVVYKAWHAGLAADFAVKVLRAGEDASAEELERFRREAQAMARLHHSGIVAVHDIGEEEGRTWMAMEYVEGVALGTLLDQRVARAGARALPAPQAIRFAREMAEAVHAAHAAGVLHRDLKPQNILVDGSGRVRVMDFGLAKLAETNDPAGATRTGALLGTPAYMSPEHVTAGMKEVDAQSDVYQLGAILYEMLTGRRAYPQGSPSEAMVAISREDPPRPRALKRDLDRDAETICLAAMAREKPRRYRSAQALAEDCARYLAGEGIRARPEGPVGRLLRWTRRRRTVAALAGAALLAVAVAIGAAVEAWEAQAEQEQVQREREAAEQEKRRLEDQVVDAVRRIADSSVKAAALIRRAGGDPATRAAAFLAPVEEAAHEASAKAQGRPEPHVQLARLQRALGDLAAAGVEVEKALAKDAACTGARYERMALAAGALARSAADPAQAARLRAQLTEDLAALRGAAAGGVSPAQRRCAEAFVLAWGASPGDAEKARASFEEALREDAELEDARQAIGWLGEEAAGS